MQPPVELRVGAELAREVARPRDFDLDHVGAEVRELVAAERSGEHVGQVEDADAGQGPGCTGSSHFASSVRPRTSFACARGQPPGRNVGRGLIGCTASAGYERIEPQARDPGDLRQCLVELVARSFATRRANSRSTLTRSWPLTARMNGKPNFAL